MILIGLLVLSGSLPCSGLDETPIPSEWFLDPAYEVEWSACVDPRDYTDPVCINDYAQAHYCNVYLVESGEAQLWRVVIIGADEIVVLQEDWTEPRIWDIPFGTERAFCSANGRFAVVQSSNGQPSLDQAVLFDIDTWDARQFDPSPDGDACGLFVSGTGDLLGYGTDVLYAYDSDVTSDPTVVPRLTSFRYAACASTTDRFITGLPGNGECSVGCFNWDGELIWELDTDSIPPVSPVLSQDGAYGVVTLRDQRAIFFDGLTGEVLWQLTPSRSGYDRLGDVCFSSDSRVCAWDVTGLDGSSIIHTGVMTDASLHETSCRNLGAFPQYPVAMSPEGWMLVHQGLWPDAIQAVMDDEGRLVMRMGKVDTGSALWFFLNIYGDLFYHRPPDLIWYGGLLHFAVSDSMGLWLVSLRER